MTRPKDMSDAEREALPVGPFLYREVPLTAEDYANGMSGRFRSVCEAPPVLASYHEDDDLLCWWDSKDRGWTFGQWADGTWFKQPWHGI